MQFQTKIVYTAISCIFILAVLFTVLYIVGFDSQDASAQIFFGLQDEVAIKIKVSTEQKQKNLEEVTRNKLENAIQGVPNLQIVPYTEKDPGNPFLERGSDWIIYFLVNQHRNSHAVSITLTHHDTFVLNHLKVIHAVTGSFNEVIDEAIELTLNVIQQKMKNKDAPIIVTGKSTIAN